MNEISNLPPIDFGIVEDRTMKKSVVDKRTAVIFVIVLLGNMLLSVSPVWFVLLSAMSGIVLKNLEGRAAK